MANFPVFFYRHSSQNTSELYLLSLQVLANLCHSNVAVQAFMKGLVRLFCNHYVHYI